MSTPPDPPAPADEHEPASRRRAALLSELAAEIRAVRTETRAELIRLATTVADNAGLLGEALPRVQQLDELVAELGEKLDALGQPAAGVDAAPVDWPALSAEEAAAEWEALATWVAQVLGPFYEIRRGQLPDCWPLHRPAVIELVWLRRCYVAAHAPDALPGAAGEWHTRWRRDALANIAAAIPTEWCRPGEHRLHINDRDQHRYAQPPPATGWTPATGPGGPSGQPHSSPRREAPEQQISIPEHWQPHYEAAAAADLAWRRDREAAPR